MFDSAYRFKGPYKAKVKKLCDPIEPGRSSTQFKIFNRMVDVLECAAIVGFCYKRRVTSVVEDGDDFISGEIGRATIIGESDKLQFIYRLIMLNDDLSGSSVTGNLDEDSILKSKIDNAFRFDSDSNQEGLNLFNSYVMGGVDILYEKFSDVKTREDAIEVMKDLLESSRRLIENGDVDVS